MIKVQSFAEICRGFDVVVEKHSTIAGENVWNIDAEYLRSKLK